MDRKKAMNVVRTTSISLLTIGIIIILLGLFGGNSSTFIAIGIGTISGAVVIFLMGVFFIATEEMLEKGRG